MAFLLLSRCSIITVQPFRPQLIRLYRRDHVTAEPHHMRVHCVQRIPPSDTHTYNNVPTFEAICLRRFLSLAAFTSWTDFHHRLHPWLLIMSLSVAHVVDLSVTLSF